MTFGLGSIQYVYKRTAFRTVLFLYGEAALFPMTAWPGSDILGGDATGSHRVVSQNALLAKLTETFEYEMIVVGYGWGVECEQVVGRSLGTGRCAVDGAMMLPLYGRGTQR
jgi:hypothetical protein